MNPIGDGGDLRAYASTSSFREATVETNSVQSIVSLDYGTYLLIPLMKIRILG